MTGTDVGREHPYYAASRAMLRKYRDLYAGGEQMKAQASQYLMPRQKEPLDVYNERLGNVFYENYIGSIIDWYSATLFRREPVITFDGANEAGQRFFGNFVEDCDEKGTSLSNFYRRQFADLLVAGRCYTLVDFPRLEEAPASRAEEEELGLSRAYLVDVSPEDIINWSYDTRGNLEWLVIRTEHLSKDSVTDTRWSKRTRWTYYDRERFEVFEQKEQEGQRGAVRKVDEGLHGLAKEHRVPVFEMRVSEGLWLMNKAALLQLEHFNKSNALSWALTMGLFAMPVVYSERDWNQVIGESYYIHLSPQDRFGWTEPEGKVYQIAADNLARLQEEIYRVCYLMTQAGSSLGAASQSGLSKLRDFAITQEVLRAYGDVVKDGIKRVLREISAAREDGLLIDVSGLDDFDIGDFSTDLSDAERLLGLGIPSATLKAQVFKKLAAKYLCDVRQDIKGQIAAEIDAGVN